MGSTKSNLFFSMTLRNYSTMPPGGLYYIAADGRRISGTNMRDLTMKVSNYYAANDIVVPDYLRQLIEDQICERLPKEYCWQQPGDVVASIIAKGASLVDKVLGTNLKEAAKGCSGCARRRRAMNEKLSS